MSKNDFFYLSAILISNALAIPADTLSISRTDTSPPPKLLEQSNVLYSAAHDQGKELQE